MSWRRRWFDPLSNGRCLSVLKGTATGDYLTSTAGAPFDVAAWDMKLTLHDRTIMTRLLVSTPVLPFTAIREATVELPVNQVGGLLLGFGNPLGPSLDHLCAVMNHHLSAHVWNLS
jgi:hypothetical protein